MFWLIRGKAGNYPTDMLLVLGVLWVFLSRDLLGQVGRLVKQEREHKNAKHRVVDESTESERAQKLIERAELRRDREEIVGPP